MHANDKSNYQKVLESIPVGVISIEIRDSRPFKVIEANPAFESMIGLNGNHLTEKTIDEISTTERAAGIIDKIAARVAAGDFSKEEIILNTPKGEQLFQAVFIPFCDNEQHSRSITVIFYEITDYEQVKNVLQEKDGHSQALLRLSRGLERAQSYGEIVGAALQEVKSVIGYQNLWVYLLTEDKKYADLITASGRNSEAIITRLEVTGDKMIEEIVAAPNYVLVEDARTDERTNKEIVAQLKNRTIVNVPIVFMGMHMGSVGMGTFGDEGVRVPSESEREFLMALASHMAITIDRIHSLIERNQALEALQETNSELAQHRHHLQSLVEERTHELSLARDAAESANRAKSMFLANMSHELRTPLNAILGFAQLMSHDKSIPDHAHGNLNIINRSGEHLLSMINDVLDLSKIEAGKTELREESFDLVRTVEDIAEMIKVRAKEKQLEVIVDMDPAIKRYVEADLGKVRQILINLLGNAVKFTDNGGIALRVRTLKPTGNTSSLILDVEVEDTGPGISEDRLDKVFVPFTQVGSAKANAKGTGLGLTISQSYAKMMGGQITVESKEGKGATFKLQVLIKPVSENAVLDVKTSRAVVEGIEEGQPEYRILIVEDNIDNAKLLELLLIQAGLNVRIASNGKEGIEVAEKWLPHFIWMDMKMPVMDGYEATTRIRAHSWGKDIVIMAFTASVFSDQENIILEAGCNGVLHKPFREQEIFEIMTKHLGVRFKYSDASEDLQNAKSNLDPSNTPSVEEIELLSAEIVDRILQAVAELDKQSIFAIADEIAVENKNVSVYLKNQASLYNFEAIEALIVPAQKKKAS